MTQEQFDNKLSDITDRELVAMAQDELGKLCDTGAKSFVMSIPPMITDTDIVFAELIRRFKLML